MSIRRIKTGPRLSQIVVHGQTVYLAGQIATGATVAEQTRAVLGQIDSLLAEVGSDKTKILSAMIYLADMSTFSELNKEWEAWVAPGNAPTRATVEASLATPEYKVEIVVVAAL
ncbi:RidA family protein [Ancylobacter terrae]|uniref:RidA family protein n=1 Tax=Ancylobacter sp. sgz301288 TaxID=3342077 RepID=UPI00385C03A4